MPPPVEPTQMPVDPIISASILLRAVGAGYAALLLYRASDLRFGALTLMLLLMFVRQLLTVTEGGGSFTELPGLLVSVLAIGAVYYLSKYVEQEGRTRRRLTRQNERLQAQTEALEQAAHGILILDTDGTIRYANRSTETVAGYGPDELVGESLIRLMPTGRGGRAYESIWETVDDGEEWDGELAVTTRDGESRWVDATVAPIVDEGDGVRRVVAVLTDVTEQRRRRQVLQVLNRVLRHNLRNKVNVVVGNGRRVRESTEHVRRLAGEIRDRSGDGDVAVAGELESAGSTADAAAEAVVRAGDELATVSDKATDIYDVVVGGSERTALVPLDDLLDRAVDGVADVAPGASLTLDASPDHRVAVPETLEIAVRELLSNAAEHSDRTEPSIQVRVTVEGESVAVVVADDGGGIPEHEREVLRRGEETPLRHGSGLGLWVIYWAVRESGWEIEIADNDPRGTRVTLRTPVGGNNVRVEPPPPDSSPI